MGELVYPWHNATLWRACSEILFRPLMPSNVDTLDLGCGSASYREIFKGFYVGVDPEISVHQKRETYLSIRFDRPVKKLDVFIVGVGESLPFKNASFSFVLCVWTLEHVKDDFKVIKEAYRVLKKHGTALFVVPSIYHPYSLYGNHGERTYTKEQFLKILKNNNFKICNFQKAGGLILRFWDEFWRYSFRLIYRIYSKRKKDKLETCDCYTNYHARYVSQRSKSFLQRAYRSIRGLSLKFFVNLDSKLALQIFPANYIAWVSK